VRAAGPLLPLVLVTTVGPATLRRIRLPEVQDILRLEDVSARLGAALNEAATRRPLLAGRRLDRDAGTSSTGVAPCAGEGLPQTRPVAYSGRTGQTRTRRQSQGVSGSLEAG
jgi:hypothetical protein